MKGQIEIPTFRKGRGKWSTALFLASLLMAFITPVVAQEKPVLVSYDLNVKILPAQGNIDVRGKIGVPVESGAKTLQFGLHETFEIKKLRVNGRAAAFLFQAADLSPIFPATRKVIVNLPSLSSGTIQMEIEYGGKLKEIPEFGTYGDQKVALDDQINSRMIELASYSSWYPQFFVFGHPIETKLEVSLPEGWTAICSGKKLEEQEKERMEGPFRDGRRCRTPTS